MNINPVVETILARRSTRSFLDKSIAREDIETIVECGRWAPSANNRQEWVFVVLDDRVRIARLAEIIRIELGRASYNMYAPQTIVLVAHSKEAPFAREDDGCALENMFLAAESLGLGSVWINQLQDICDRPAIRAELDTLGVPSEYEVHGICALGYVDRATPQRPCKSAVVWA